MSCCFFEEMPMPGWVFVAILLFRAVDCNAWFVSVHSLVLPGVFCCGCIGHFLRDIFFFRVIRWARGKVECYGLFCSVVRCNVPLLMLTQTWGLGRPALFFPCTVALQARTICAFWGGELAVRNNWSDLIDGAFLFLGCRIKACCSV